jgi:hypothetical protein
MGATLLVALNLVTLLEIPEETTVEDVMLLARLGCSEAGYDEAEVKRVLRVVYNRSKLRNTSVIVEAKRRGQFYYKNCQGKTANWLKWFHISIAIEAARGTIVSEAAINQPSVTHFATTKRLDQVHARCKPFTIRQVWEYNGLRRVYTSGVGHEYFSKEGGKPGCPPKEGHDG